jgi:hypothetical protein
MIQINLTLTDEEASYLAIELNMAYRDYEDVIYKNPDKFNAIAKAFNCFRDKNKQIELINEQEAEIMRIKNKRIEEKCA